MLVVLRRTSETTELDEEKGEGRREREREVETRSTQTRLNWQEALKQGFCTSAILDLDDYYSKMVLLSRPVSPPPFQISHTEPSNGCSA